jgi:hypothetical protein
MASRSGTLSRESDFCTTLRSDHADLGKRYRHQNFVVGRIPSPFSSTHAMI